MLYLDGTESPTDIKRFWAPHSTQQKWTLNPELLASVHITWTHVVWMGLKLYTNCLLNCLAYGAWCCVHLFVLIASTIGYFWVEIITCNKRFFLIENNSESEDTMRICTKKIPSKGLKSKMCQNIFRPSRCILVTQRQFSNGSPLSFFFNGHKLLSLRWLLLGFI